MDWSDEANITLLRALWDAGLSTGQIAKKMRTTKNAIVGKAHRLRLVARSSPIGAYEWTAERDAQLGKLRAEGLTFLQCGQRMDVSESAARMRAQRLGLPLAKATTNRQPRVVPRKTLGDLPSLASGGKPTMPWGRDAHSALAVLRVRKEQVAKPASGVQRTCQWPTWPDKSRPPRPATFCGAPVLVCVNARGEEVAVSYCADHHARAYVRLRAVASAVEADAA